MLNFLATLFFAIGLVISAFGIGTFCFSMSEKFRESRERKQAHEKRLITLLESIDQKLNAKP